MDIVKQEIALFCAESVQPMFYIPCHPYVSRIIFSAKVFKCLGLGPVQTPRFNPSSQTDFQLLVSPTRPTDRQLRSTHRLLSNAAQVAPDFQLLSVS